MNWKISLVVAGIAAITAGCQTVGYVPGGSVMAWSKPTATRAQERLDNEECILDATQQIQPAMGVATTPGFSSPGSLMCNSVGSMTTCNNVGAVNIPGSAYSYDANMPVRKLFVKVCMEKKGYTLSQSKWCDDPHDLTTEGCVVPILPQ